jgi:hypothetical protein
MIGQDEAQAVDGGMSLGGPQQRERAPRACAKCDIGVTAGGLN